ncbi:uncharacterized protein JCM6883_004137 [Sporobolomyces salmoneus]|uniref:uncharacterized protein n=1 Tax=Sporobolomyces salmoneus TaxID=183962 RepID=UPI00317E0F7D
MPDANVLSGSSGPSKAWKKAELNPQVARISNPIREIIAGIDLSAPPEEGVDKPLINLGIGDPSVYGNFKPAQESIDAIRDSLEGLRSLGYPESVGYADAREAVANYFSQGPDGNFKPTKDDVVMSHGCSGALESAISTLCSEGKNLLVSRPLFTAYEAMAAVSNVELRYYDLLPQRGFECDLDHIDSLIDENTAAIILCNPGNPTGTNYSAAHLKEFAALMSQRQVVVIADEVYAGLAWSVSGPRPKSADAPRVQGKFNAGVFTPYASVCGDSPVIVVGAVSKRWLAPGWRLGWIILHDPQGVLAEIKGGLAKYSFRLQGPNSTMQRALPAILTNTPEKFYVDTMDKLEKTGIALHARLSKIEGLEPLMPQGAMYLICSGLKNFEFENDKAFVEALHEEERVFILPGACFRLEGYMRFVTTTPLDILMSACDRIEAFCDRHRKVSA